MDRGRLRRYALRVVAAVSLGVGVVVVAGGIANAGTIPTTTYGKILPVQTAPGTASPDDASWI
jgi:hypothetical protein